MVEYQITDEAVEAARDELAGWQIGSGYYATQVAVDEALDMARAALEAALPYMTASTEHHHSRHRKEDTMTERIDHAAEAQRLGKIATVQAGAEPVAPLAQFHATLALVEQQRIANLIALASMADDDSKHEVIAGTLGHEAVWTLATTKTLGLDDEFEIVHPDIAAALGIEDAS